MAFVRVVIEKMRNATPTSRTSSLRIISSTLALYRPGCPSLRLPKSL
ncbi:hypothetical protein FOVG_19989 [Fusarium oxysporum f. sp. pisi HDV247]|uniref:Uncharacterized protein n=1 Tax=Fusarium oxysporum f. sp. pisi HDV247 TaxID=1080344 RepID=W9NKL1_FUSOX|nr:hypothetical protein FOVG_19989 [Fusarium oxysporum f. sp. pisi HDV247]